MTAVALWGCGHSNGDAHGHDTHEEAEADAGHSGDGDGDEHEHGVVLFSKHQMEAGGVKLATVESGSFAGVIKTSGEIVTAQGAERTIAAPAAGVVSFNGAQLTPGHAVGAGQRLFTISAKGVATTDNSAELRSALKAAERKLARQRDLLARKMTTQAEYDDALAEYEAAKAALSSPATRAIAGGAAASPIAGYITECLVRPGDYVEVGTPLATVSATRRLQLRADVPRKYASLLSRIKGANISVPGLEEAAISLSEHNARVVSYGKAAPKGSIYIPVFIEFDNPGNLPTGTPVETYLLTEERGDAVVVPRSALTEEEGTFFVYVETQPEHFRKQKVTTGQSDGLQTEIFDGLKPGEKIVVKGATLLKLAANSGKAPEGHRH